MHDGLLTISNITLSHLQSPEFVFLLACCNEAIPLAAAMRLSGFRSVIGYMQSVNENVAGQITPALYSNFVDGDLGDWSVAQGLMIYLRHVSRLT
jgi:hypothetical protein